MSRTDYGSENRSEPLILDLPCSTVHEPIGRIFSYLKPDWSSGFAQFEYADRINLAHAQKLLSLELVSKSFRHWIWKYSWDTLDLWFEDPYIDPELDGDEILEVLNSPRHLPFHVNYVRCKTLEESFEGVRQLGLRLRSNVHKLKYLKWWSVCPTVIPMGIQEDNSFSCFWRLPVPFVESKILSVLQELPVEFTHLNLFDMHLYRDSCLPLFIMSQKTSLRSLRMKNVVGKRFHQVFHSIGQIENLQRLELNCVWKRHQDDLGIEFGRQGTDFHLSTALKGHEFKRLKIKDMDPFFVNENGTEFNEEKIADIFAAPKSVEELIFKTRRLQRIVQLESAVACMLSSKCVFVNGLTSLKLKLKFKLPVSQAEFSTKFNDLIPRIIERCKMLKRLEGKL